MPTAPFGGSPGAQVFPGFQPTIAGQRVDQAHDRNNKSLYAEIDSDITDAVNIQGALRYEDYSDFGSDLNWKLAGRFEPVDGHRLARLGLDRLPRSLAAAAILCRRVDPERQRRAARYGDPAGQQSGRAGARRQGTDRRAEPELFGRPGVQRRSPAQRHARRLSGRDRRPHRGDRESRRVRQRRRSNAGAFARSSARPASRPSPPRASSSTASTPAPAASTWSRPTASPTSSAAGSTSPAGSTTTRPRSPGTRRNRGRCRPFRAWSCSVARNRCASSRASRGPRSIRRSTSTGGGSARPFAPPATARCWRRAPTGSTTSISTPRRSPTSSFASSRSATGCPSRWAATTSSTSIRPSC